MVLVRLDFGLEKLMTEASETVQSLTPADGMRWYVVHAYSGMEKAVERNIMERVGNAGMEAKFGRTLVARVRSGQQVCR